MDEVPRPGSWQDSGGIDCWTRGRQGVCRAVEPLQHRRSAGIGTAYMSMRGIADRPDGPLTLTVGIATRRLSEDIDGLVSRADEALHSARRAALSQSIDILSILPKSQSLRR